MEIYNKIKNRKFLRISRYQLTAKWIKKHISFLTSQLIKKNYANNQKRIGIIVAETQTTHPKHVSTATSKIETSKNQMKSQN